MATVTERENISLEAADISGQKVVRVAGVSPTSTIGELLKGLVPKMELPVEDVDGRPMAYHARLEREARHLHATEIVGDVLEPGDRLVLQPNIMAG